MLHIDNLSLQPDKGKKVTFAEEDEILQTPSKKLSKSYKAKDLLSFEQPDGNSDRDDQVTPDVDMQESGVDLDSD